MTALGFVETAKMEGHKAIVHAAAASNLGQMLHRICAEDGIPLVNIVRSDDQVALLRGQGAEHVLNSTDENFQKTLTAAVELTGATIAFDPIGGGILSNQILTAMEVAAQKRMPVWSRYGSDEHKQIYIYGMLDPAPTALTRGYGFAWSVSGWLLMPFLQRAGLERMFAMQQRVLSGLKTTFASQYSDRVSLEQALELSAVQAYGRKATGQKTLITMS
jgi:NADPH2:quinone reductase